MSGLASALSYYEEKAEDEGGGEGNEGGEGVGRLLEEIVERNGSQERNPIDKLVRTKSRTYFYKVYMYILVHENIIIIGYLS